jgi:hypothetical protein
MNFLKSIAVLLALFVNYGLYAQDNQLSVERETALSEVWVQPSLTGYFGVNATLADFRKLAPESVILNRDYSDWDNGGNSLYGTSSTGGSGFSVLLGFHLKDKDGKLNKNRTLRLGVAYGYAETLYSNISRSSATRIDTVVSITTGEEFFIDSLSNESVGMSYDSHILNLDASLIFRTNHEARWSLYGGVGMRAGISINPCVDVSYVNFNGYEGPITPGDSFGAIDNEFESFNQESSFVGSLYIPLGLDFRLGNNPFWSQTHLMLEFSPNMLFADVPDLKTYTQFGFTQSFGLRVTW